MKKKIPMSFIAVLLPIAAFAAGDWKGKVQDDKGEPIPFANVVVVAKTDSTVLSGTTTAEDGTFNIAADGSSAKQ